MSARVLALALAAILSAMPARAEGITVAVAANFLTTLEDITAAFTAETGHEVAIVHGSTGKLYAQIVAGAPFDLFLSADADRPERLAREGRAATEPRTYAIGHLALVHRDSVAPGTLDEILSRPGLRIAIADPDVAPYGGAARSVLEAFRGTGWNRDLVLGESVGQAFAFVATGNADLGLVALSQVLTYEGGLWSLTVPDDLHEPILQDAVILNRAATSAAARDFLDYLSGPFARQVMAEAGYGLP